MDLGLAGPLIAGLVCAPLWLIRLYLRRTEKRVFIWESVSDSLGLEYDRKRLQYDLMRGPIGDCHVTVTYDLRCSPPTQIFVTASRAIPASLSIVPRWVQRPAPAGLSTGDTRWDDEMRLAGDRAEVLAILDHDTRKLMSEAARVFHASVEMGALQGSLPSPAITSEVLIGAITTLVQLAERLALDRKKLSARLIANLSGERNGFVRQAIFETLMRIGAAEPETRARAIEVALSGVDLQLRTAAAIEKGVEGLPVLRAILQGSGADGLRARALRQLAIHLPREEVLPWIDPLLAQHRSALRDEAIETALRHQHAAALPRILRILETAERDEVPIIARALGRIRDPRVESALVRLLEHPELEVRVVAARSLGNVGTLASVEPLLELSRRVLLSREVKVAAQQAVTRIQARYGAGDPGGLSLVKSPEESGALSFEQDEGAVSITDS